MNGTHRASPPIATVARTTMIVDCESTVLVRASQLIESALISEDQRSPKKVRISKDSARISNQFKNSTQTALEMAAVWGVAVRRPVFASTRNTVRLFES